MSCTPIPRNAVDINKGDIVIRKSQNVIVIYNPEDEVLSDTVYQDTTSLEY